MILLKNLLSFLLQYYYKLFLTILFYLILSYTINIIILYILNSNILNTCKNMSTFCYLEFSK